LSFFQTLIHGQYGGGAQFSILSKDYRVKAINHAANAIPGWISGLVCISPSTAEFVQAELKKKTMTFTIPTLWIMSEEDMTNFEALDMFKDIKTAGTTLVSFKDDILGLSMKLSAEFSIWGVEMANKNPGLVQHMAIACEEEVVADVPIVSFMRRTFGASDEEARAL
jgi:hypothetical protein